MDRSTVRVLLADPMRLSREAFAEELRLVEGIEVVAAVADHDAAEMACHEQRPDVALLDLELPSRGGIATTAAVKLRAEGVRVLLLSPWADHDLLTAAVEAGVDSFVTKTMSVDNVVEAIRRTHAGEAIIPPRMLGTLLQGLLRRNAEAERATRLLAQLTRREREILTLLVEGCDHNAIANRLVISPETAKTHIQNIITKLGVHSRLAAAALAVEHGLVPRPAASAE